VVRVQDMRNILFGLKQKQSFLAALGIDRTHPVISAIMALAHPKSIQDTFAFLYKPVFARPPHSTTYVPHVVFAHVAFDSLR
jgi:hypothetical protein